MSAGKIILHTWPNSSLSLFTLHPLWLEPQLRAAVSSIYTGLPDFLVVNAGNDQLFQDKSRSSGPARLIGRYSSVSLNPTAPTRIHS